MKGFNIATALGVRRNPWTCGRCFAQAQRGFRYRKGFSSRAGHIPRIDGRRNVILAAAATGGGIAATAVAFAEPVQHAYEAAERTGRVVGTLLVCVNE
jgi:aarF domain-containing kinase